MKTPNCSYVEELPYNLNILVKKMYRNSIIFSFGNEIYKNIQILINSNLNLIAIIMIFIIMMELD